MKKILCLISILVLVFAVSCSKKKSHDYEERVSKKISAEDGGKIESSDGKTSIEIPAGALDEDTTITMTIRNAEGYEGTEEMDVIGSIVEFEPSGKVFKKPVIITMPSLKTFERKVVSAAVLHGTGEKWSYSGHGAMALLHQEEKDDAGDPIITTVAGDKVMLSAAGDPIMQSSGEMLAAAGDPVMLGLYGGMSAAGDPIMQTAAGKQIGISAAGDPIMNSAAGDPIMMTTGHFSAYTFVIAGEELAEKPDEEPENDEDITGEDKEPAVDDEDEISDEDENHDVDEDPVIPEPEKVYSKAVCTGLRTCVNGTGAGYRPVFTRAVETEKQDINPLECPKQGADLYGQDAQYAIRKSCVPQDFERLSSDESDNMPYLQVKDKNTGLTWLYTGSSGSFEEMSAFCSELDYAGKTWRLPTPAEFMTIVDRDATGTPVLRQLYFNEIFLNNSNNNENYANFWTSVDTLYFYNDGSIMRAEYSEGISNSVMCVSGKEYGKVTAANYTSETVNGDEAIRDSSTNLLWQKSYVSGKTWDQALEYCENLKYAGYSDWRLPNINELTTLLDYSKTKILSSFPGMTANVFASSTNKGGRVWAVSMGEGRIDYILSDNETGDEEEGNDGEEWEEGEEEYEQGESSGTVFSVRCVRSDLDDLPADGIPLCNEKIGYAPCRDASTKKIWSPIVPSNSEYEGYEPYRSGEGGTWADIARTCRDMTFNGKRQWRIPTIDELRTLVKDEKLKAGGICGVKSGCLADSCYNEVACTIDGETAFESRLRDYGILVSGDAVENEDHTYEAVWAIHTPYGALSEFISEGSYVARCVFDETLPDVDFPYTQKLGEENSLVWSSMSDSEIYWSDAATYCMELEEEGSDSWRVPTIDELSLLAKQNEDCLESDCAPNTKGGNSIFGDVDILWSSDTGYDFFYAFDFMYNQVSTLDSYSTARVRCISGEMAEPAGK